MYRKILLAADGSDHSRRAAAEALKMAKMFSGSAVTLLYVVDYEKARTEMQLSKHRDEPQFHRGQLLLPLEEMFTSAGVPIEAKTLHGAPGPTIIRYANENSYDIVFIGSRGLNAFQEMVLGSVSHKVAKRVQAPVVIVK
ncbi:universal stress protein [Planococcus sp. CAU13]|uniref:universal stress protein n=1 Tax=Planococcus sp. CAU13 TaxID=1541197 RepID=UPI00052FF6B6|nr:universal stress protein [Planococcus sp. CAU13]